MADDGPPALDDELAAVIRTAFEQQTIPPKPDVSEVAADSQRPQSQNFVSVLIDTPSHANRFAKLFGSLPVIVATLLLLIAIWPEANRSIPVVKSASETATSLQDSENGGADDVTEGGDKETGDDASSASPESKAEQVVLETTGIVPTDQAESKLLGVVRLFNESVVSPPFDSESLSQMGVESLGTESVPLWEGIKAMGMPKGIKSIREGAGEKHSWIASEREVSFTYQIEWKDLMNDLDRFIEGMIGENILFPILDGIRDDPEGPKVDLRREVFARLKGDIMVVINQSARPNGDQVMFVAPIVEVAGVSDVLQRVAFVETSATIEIRQGVRIMVVSRDNRTEATAVAGGCLIIGSAEMVRHAIDRLPN